MARKFSTHSDPPWQGRAARSVAATGPNRGGGQAFRRHGRVGNDWATAIGDIQAMTGRLLIRTAEAARRTADIVEEEIVKYALDAQSQQDFSAGRLAATIGTWKPELIEDGDIRQIAEDWAIEAGVSGYPEDPDMDPTMRDVIYTRFGAYRAIKRWRYNIYSVEVGTFTPYAGLVEDGGTMEIHPYGDRRRTTVATWSPVHMFKRGTFDAYDRIHDEMERAVFEAL